MSKVTGRSRRLRINEPRFTEEMGVLAAAVLEANARKNAATRDEKRAQAKLDALAARMTDGQPFTFDGVAVLGDEEVAVTVEYARALREGVDVDKLWSKVDHGTFLRCVTASKERVQESAGSNVLQGVTVDVLGDFKARVSRKKG